MRHNYYVVASGRGSTRHISHQRPRYGEFQQSLGYGVERTLCAKPANRDMGDVFSLSEVNCTECKRRREQEIAAEAAKTPRQKQIEFNIQAAVFGLVIVLFVIVMIWVFTK